MSLPEDIRNAVLNSAKTQRAIARECCLTDAAISQFITGKNNLTSRNLSRVAHVVGYEIVARRIPPGATLVSADRQIEPGTTLRIGPSLSLFPEEEEQPVKVHGRGPRRHKKVEEQ